jgi:hypothetical protein
MMRLWRSYERSPLPRAAGLTSLTRAVTRDQLASLHSDRISAWLAKASPSISPAMSHKVGQGMRLVLTPLAFCAAARRAGRARCRALSVCRAGAQLRQGAGSALRAAAAGPCLYPASAADCMTLPRLSGAATNTSTPRTPPPGASHGTGDLPAGRGARTRGAPQGGGRLDQRAAALAAGAGDVAVAGQQPAGERAWGCWVPGPP